MPNERTELGSCLLLNNLKGHLLTQWGSVILVKITAPQSTKSLHFMKPKSSLPHSREPITVPILSQISPVQSIPPITLYEDPF